MKHRLSPITAAVLLCLASCSRDKTMYDDPDTLNPDGGHHSSMPSYTFEPELSDDRCRFVSPDIELYYDNGGILFCRDQEDGRTVYRAVDLQTGSEVLFSMPAGAIKGPVISPELAIDGKVVVLSSATVERIEKSGVWIDILTPDNKHSVLVVSGL